MKPIKTITLCISFLGLLLWTFWPVHHLRISSIDRAKAPLSFPVSSGDRFSIWFLHSYDRAFFQENYAIGPRYQILLKDMSFQSHLNGAGFSYPNFYLRSDGVGELREINEPRDRVEFMMGSKDLANHSLLWKGKKIELSQFFEPGEIIHIQVGKTTRMRKLLE